jgi:hypothetical protein
MKHVGAGADHGDYASKCDRCQCPYLRSELTRARDGLLECDECDGRCALELDEANAASAKDAPQFGPNDGGRYDTVDNTGATSLETKLATLGTP